MRLGFFNAPDLESFPLKCTPCFLSTRKCSNLVLVPTVGDPGGDGGISYFGEVGRVRSRSSALLAEYGDAGVESLSEKDSSISATGCEGPRRGPTGEGPKTCVKSMAVSSSISERNVRQAHLDHRESSHQCGRRWQNGSSQPAVLLVIEPEKNLEFDLQAMMLLKIQVGPHRHHRYCSN